MPKSGYAHLFMALAAVFLLMTACARKPASTADVPRIISHNYRISVAPFTQPLHPGQLITGQIPENQGRIPDDALLALDMDLRQALYTQTKRQYDFIKRQNLPQDWMAARSQGQPGALPRWVAYGEKNGAQLLLVPQVLNWHEREGSGAGVTSSAQARVEFYLINIPESMLAGRSIYDEKQVGLAENLLTVADFMKRKGQWVSARELVVEGMARAVRELGL